MRSLFILHDVIAPATSGGRQRSALIYSALSQVGDVDTVVLSQYLDQIPESSLAEMQKRFSMVGCRQIAHPSERGFWRRLLWINPSLIQRLAHNVELILRPYRADVEASKLLDHLIRTNAYDLIVIRYLKLAALTGALRYDPVIVDVDDLDSEVYASRLSVQSHPLWERSLLRAYSYRFRKLEAGILSKCRSAFVTKPSDIGTLGLKNVKLLPNIPYAPNGEIRPLPPAMESKTIILVGTLDWPRNVEGVDFFLAHVWQNIRRQEPDAALRLVGKVTESNRKRWSSAEGVEVLGFVDSIEEVYRDAAFSVAPILAGGGTNIKVLESFAYGRTCVALPHGVRGLDEHLRNAESIRIAATARDMATACVDLLRNPETAAGMAGRGREMVMEHYSFERFSRTVREAVEEALIRTNGQKQVAVRGGPAGMTSS